MISASRRTDIPCFYSEWFFHRLQAGFVHVRNPVRPRQISRVPLTADVVDGFVFWTKNPFPMRSHLHKLAAYPYYFQFTLTPYGRDMEPGLPDKEEQLIPMFQQLSAEIGRNRMVWRYDPVLLSARYTVNFHKEKFSAFSQQLAPYTDTCIFSFLDRYRKNARKMDAAGIVPPDEHQRQVLLEAFSKTAKANGIQLQSCCEAVGTDFGIAQAHCVDRLRMAQICGYALPAAKDKNQRPLCGCGESIDIGMYHCCKNHCLYCYANESYAAVQNNFALHNSASPLLYGEIQKGDCLRHRDITPNKTRQISFFEL